MASLDTYNFFPEDEEDSQASTNNNSSNIDTFIDNAFPDDFHFSDEQIQQMQQEQQQKEAEQKEEEARNKQLEIEEEKSWVDTAASDMGRAFTTGEVFKAPFAGIEKAINETADFFGDIGNWMEEKTGVGRLVWDREGRFSFLPSYWDRKEVKEGLANGKLKLDDTIIDTIENVDMISDDFNTVSGSLVEGITRFTVGMLSANKAMNLKRGTKFLTNLRNTTIAAGAADMVVFDPEMDNLSAWLTKNGWAEGTFAEYLATDMSDSKFKNRLRNLGEGVVIGVPLELLFRAGKLAKLKQKAQADPNNKAIVSEIDRVEDETIKIVSNSSPLKEMDINLTKEELKKFAPSWFKEDKTLKDLHYVELNNIPNQSAKTAIKGTESTYRKVEKLLNTKDKKTLDFGAGRGIGAKQIGADTYEPFVDINPTYKSSEDIASESYDRIVSLNVLNVIKPYVYSGDLTKDGSWKQWVKREDLTINSRIKVVREIGRILKPNGEAVISTRGMDVFGNKANPVKGILGAEPMSVLTSTGTYQKGFKPDELLNFVGNALGEGYKVEKVAGVGKAAVKITKLNKTVTRPSTEKKIKNKKTWFGGSARVDLDTIETNTRAERESIREQTRVIAEETKVGKQDKINLVKEFEASINKDLAPENQIKIIKNGKIDEQAYRDAGNQLLKDPDRIDQIAKNMELVEKAQGRQGHLVAWSKGDRRLREDEAVSPFLNPEALDGFTALATNFRKVASSDNYKGKFKWDNKKKTIDNIFDMGITQEMDGQLLLDTLQKSGLTFNQFILATIGSASEAGRVLQKFRGITDPAKLKGTKGKEFNDMLDKEEAINSFWLRIENVRRGAMVSSIPTAARNFTSAMIRLPAEGLGNMMDTVIYDMSRGGIRSGASSLFSATKWKDSFSSWSNLTATDLKKLDDWFFSKEFKGMEKWHKKLYGQMNEIRRLTGRKEGESIGRGEAAIQRVENFVDWLNIPNRAQEFLVRRSVFFGEMQRLTRREWNLDFWKALEDGQLRAMMNNASSVRPSINSKTFDEILEDATTRALDVTYAKQADSQVGRDFTTFITRNGLTVLIPFPRFMVNSIELMLQYGGGASIPLTRKVKDFVVGNKTRPLTDRDRMLISRNMVGVAAMMAAYQYRMGSDSEDYKKMDVNDTTVADVTPQFPLRQYLWIGEAIKRWDSGEFGDWFNWRETVETFGGTNVRAGQGHSVIEGLANIVNSSGATDAVAEERTAKVLGQFVGNYIGSWAIPVAQIADIQRSMGLRSEAQKDYAQQERPIVGAMERFKEEALLPTRRRGVFNLFSPSSEQDLPDKQYLFQEGDTKDKKYPWAKSLMGLNLMERDSKEGRFFTEYGLLEWVQDSKSDIPSVKNAHNRLMREALPLVMDKIELKEIEILEAYDNRKKALEESGTNTDNLPSSERAMRDEVKAYAKQKLQELRTLTGDVALVKQDATVMLDLTIQFKRLTASQRKNAINRFMFKNGIEPDYTNPEHVDELITLGKKKIK